MPFATAINKQKKKQRQRRVASRDQAADVAVHLKPALSLRDSEGRAGKVGTGLPLAIGG